MDEKIGYFTMSVPEMPSSSSFPCMDLDSPSSSTSVIHPPPSSGRRTLPYRAVSQQFETPAGGIPHRNSRRSSTRRAIRRLSQLFHRVRDHVVAHIPLWSPIETPNISMETPASAPGNLVGLSDDLKEKSPFDLDPKTIEVDEELNQKAAVEVEINNSDQYIIKEDFNAIEKDQISVSHGDKVELLDRFASPDQEFVAVAVIDEETKKPSTKRGNVPYRILFSLDNGWFINF